MIRISWRIKIDWCGASERELFIVLYLTHEQYQELYKKLIEENKFDGLIIEGSKNIKIHNANKKYKIKDSNKLAYRPYLDWLKKKQPFDKIVEINSTYMIWNSWDVKVAIDEQDTLEPIEHIIRKDL